MIYSKIIEKIKTNFSEYIVSLNTFRDELTITIKKNGLVQICKFLRDDDELCFDSLRDICGVDNDRSTDRFEVVYNLFSLKNKSRLRLKVNIDESDIHIPSVTGIWEGANWNERETYDMFGIIFDGHPDLRRIYMPEEFKYHPLRKNFPLMGIPGSLSFPHK